MPGKNTIVREHLRKDAAKPGPQAGALWLEEPKTLLGLFREAVSYRLCQLSSEGFFWKASSLTMSLWAM